MSINLKIIALTFIFLLVLLVMFFSLRKKISVKYTIFWCSCLCILVLFTLFPDLLLWFTKLFGIQLASNFIFAILIGVLFFVTIYLTMVVSEQNEKIRKLIQEVSLLKNEKNKKN